MHEKSGLNAKAAEAQFFLADMWQSKGKIDRAIAGYQDAVRLQPDYVPAHLELGNLLLRQGRIDEAIAVFRSAIELNPDEPCFRKKLADLLVKKNRQYGENPGHTEEVLTIPQQIDTKLGHILLYTDCPGIYGAEQLNHLLMCGMKESGYHITCVQSEAAHYLIDERIRMGIQHIWIEDDNIYDITRTPHALINREEARNIFTMTKPDLIIFCDGCPLSNLAAKQVANQMQIPFINIVHSVTADWARQFVPYLHNLPDIYTQAKTVVSVSYENLSLLRELFGLPENRGQVIYNGRPSQYFTPVDPSVRRKLRQDLGIPSNAVISFTAARMDFVKGYQYQLKAMRQLQQSEIWSQIYFIWVGTGSLESRLRAMAIRDGVTDHIRFLSERPDIPLLLNAVDIFALPSHFEGMPLALIEAMAKGLPAIATSISGIPEALGNTGKLLPDPGIDPQATVSELAATMQAWTEDEKLRYSIGLACKKRAEELFRGERMLEDYKRIIKEVMKTLKNE